MYAAHIFVYKPNASCVCMREYLCSCSNCLELKFENCESLITANFDEIVADLNQCENESSNSEDECALDEDFEDDNDQNVFNFITFPSCIALITGYNQFIFSRFLKKVKQVLRCTTSTGLFVLPDELYLKGNYLVKTRCKNINRRKFRILDDPVLVTNFQLFY